MMGRPANTAEDFWCYVQKTETCWLWTGPRTRYYGNFCIGGKVVLAHRFSYELNIGSAIGFCVCHRCDVPLCVRPDHLFKGTQADNLRDCISKGRRPNKEHPIEREYA
jgi:hypothetical protein